MSLRELHRKLDELERRALTKRAGVLPILDCIDLPTVERWQDFMPSERDAIRANLETQQAEAVAAVAMDHSGDSLAAVAAILVRAYLPPESELWRSDYVETEPERAKPEPVELPSPSWPELRDAYADANDRRRARIAQDT